MADDPPWLLIVGAASGSKTEQLALLSEHPDVFPLSDLSEKTFASGLTPWQTGGEDPSLLARLTNQILVMKDFTSVLSMHKCPARVNTHPTTVKGICRSRNTSTRFSWPS